MKPIELVIHNIGIIKDVTIPLTKDGVIIAGEVKQGKTTVLNSIKYLFGTSYPSDIIRHGESEAMIKVTFETGETVCKEFYKGRDGSLKNRKVKFLDKWGSPVSKPVDEIKKFISPFTLNQDYLINMSIPERRRYFMEAFNVDTAELDNKIAEIQSKIKEQKAIVSIAPTGDITPITVVDPAPIRDQIRQVEKSNEESMTTYFRNDSNNRSEYERKKSDYEYAQSRLAKLKAEVDTLTVAMMHPPGVFVKEEQPTRVDTAPLQQQLEEALKSEQAFKHYNESLALLNKGRVAKGVIAQLTADKKNIVDEKFRKIKEINSNHNIIGLVFDDFGSFTYEDTDASMLSTSQLMRLTSEMNNLYPEAIELETVDRAESLGTSVIEYITKATKEGKTILASIVGESPAKDSDRIGVFVIENGAVK